MGLLNFRYGCLLSIVIPAPAYARAGYGGNDGQYIGSGSETRHIRFQTTFSSVCKAFPL